jgi:hypothetical protein
MKSDLAHLIRRAWVSVPGPQQAAFPRVSVGRLVGLVDTCEVGCTAQGEHGFDGAWQVSWSAENAVFVVTCVFVRWMGSHGQAQAAIINEFSWLCRATSVRAYLG